MKKTKLAKTAVAVAVSTLIPLTLMGNAWNVDESPVFYTPMETYSLYGGDVYNSGQFTTLESWSRNYVYYDLGSSGDGFFEKSDAFFTFTLAYMADQGDNTEDVVVLTLDDALMPCFLLDRFLYSKDESDSLWFGVSGRCSVSVSLTLEKAGTSNNYNWYYTHTSLTSPSTLLGTNGNTWDDNQDMRVNAYYSANLTVPFYHIDNMSVTLTCDDLTEIISDFGLREDDSFTQNEYYRALDVFTAVNGGGTITPPPVIVEPSPTDLLFAPIESFLQLELFPGFTVETLFIIAVAIGVFGVFLKFYAGG